MHSAPLFGVSGGQRVEFEPADAHQLSRPGQRRLGERLAAGEGAYDKILNQLSERELVELRQRDADGPRRSFSRSVTGKHAASNSRKVYVNACI